MVTSSVCQTYLISLFFKIIAIAIDQRKTVEKKMLEKELKNFEFILDQMMT